MSLLAKRKLKTRGNSWSDLLKEQLHQVSSHSFYPPSLFHIWLANLNRFTVYKTTQISWFLGTLAITATTIGTVCILCVCVCVCSVVLSGTHIYFIGPSHLTCTTQRAMKQLQGRGHWPKPMTRNFTTMNQKKKWHNFFSIRQKWHPVTCDGSIQKWFCAIICSNRTKIRSPYSRRQIWAKKKMWKKLNKRSEKFPTK